MTPQKLQEAAPPVIKPWYTGLTGYHWWVLSVASLGWLFDTMDQRIFVLSRGPALMSLLPAGTSPADITWYSGLATSIFMAGWAIGGFYLGIIGDRWGRARTMMLTILMYSLFTGLSALSRNWWDFIAYRFLTGLGVGGEFAAGVSLVAEVMPDHARAHALGILQALSTVGNITGSAISLVVLPLGWRWMFLVGIVPALLVVFVFRTMKEPEAWQKARASAQVGAQNRMGSAGDLFRDRRWRRNTFIGLSLAISGVVGLWGIGFWTPELIRSALASAPAASRNWYASMGTLLQDVGAFFGIYGFTIITARVGRRKAFVAAFLIGLAATVMTFGWLRRPQDVFWMIPVLGFCNLSVFGGYSIYFPELYPTRLRSTGVGFCYNVGRIVAALGPFTLGGLTVVFAKAGFASPFRAAAILLASIYLLGVFTMRYAPETMGKPLPEE
ncbi:MAG TPA: MFS transporter [Bryobacterales bacterium]|jgi:MFS family permease|nr:MFS transporter [Bryobacterales bacterium]